MKINRTMLRTVIREELELMIVPPDDDSQAEESTHTCSACESCTGCGCTQPPQSDTLTSTEAFSAGLSKGHDDRKGFNYSGHIAELPMEDAWEIGYLIGLMGLSEAEPADVTDAWHPREVEAREDVWSGGDNIDSPLDHSHFETGESNTGPHTPLSLAEALGLLNEADSPEIMKNLNNLLITAKKKIDNYKEEGETTDEWPVGDHEITVRINLKDPELSTTVTVDNPVIQKAYEKSLNDILVWAREPGKSDHSSGHTVKEIESYRQAVSAAREAGKDRYAMRIGYIVSPPPAVQSVVIDPTTVQGEDPLGDFGGDIEGFDL